MRVDYCINSLSAKKVQSESESDSMLTRTSPSGFAVLYQFSISITGGFAFEHVQKHYIW